MQKTGTLYIIATPIGNLGDLTERAKKTLESSDVIAAEDTRHSLKLLRHLELSKPLIRCDELFQRRQPDKLLGILLSGQNVALVTDAGTPGISDPGAYIISEAWKIGAQISPIPGPSAVTAALSICGFKVVPFTFYGFIAKKGQERTQILDEIAFKPYASCFFESPFRLIKTLEALSALSPDRWVFVARELTKKFEQTYRGPLHSILEVISSQATRGEYTVVVAPLQ